MNDSSQKNLQTRNTEPAGKKIEKEGKLPSWLVYLFALVGLAYLFNPSFGLFELIPDALPIVGNLDEGAAALLFWSGLQHYRDRRKRQR